MLSDEERTAIDAGRAHYPDGRAVLVEALKIVQQHRRWVSDEAVADIAEHLGLSKAAVDNVATFYNLIFRRPVGQHVVLVCDSVSCWIMGYEQLWQRLQGHLGVEPGGTTEDGRFTLLPMCCLGACDHAPMLMIDDDLHHDVRPDAVGDLLARYAGDGAGGPMGGEG